MDTVLGTLNATTCLLDLSPFLMKAYRTMTCRWAQVMIATGGSGPGTIQGTLFKKPSIITSHLSGQFPCTLPFLLLREDGGKRGCVAVPEDHGWNVLYGDFHSCFRHSYETERALVALVNDVWQEQDEISASILGSIWPHSGFQYHWLWYPFGSAVGFVPGRCSTVFIQLLSLMFPISFLVFAFVKATLNQY